MESLTTEEALLDLLLTNEEELLKQLKFGGSLSCSNHALEEFSILMGTGQVESGVSTLNLRNANFWLFRALVSWIPLETALKEVNKSWELFKDLFLGVQELSIPTHRKSGRGDRRPSWLCQDLLTKLKCKTKMHRQWRQGYTSWGDFRDMAQVVQGGDQESQGTVGAGLGYGHRK